MMRAQCLTAIFALTCVVPAVSANAQHRIMGTGYGLSYGVMSDTDCDCGIDEGSVCDECGMCCPRILPAIWSGLRNVFDCLFPCGACCHGCGVHHFPHLGRYSHTSCRNCWEDYCMRDGYPSDGAIVVPAPQSAPQTDGPPAPPPDLQGRRTGTSPVHSSLYYGPRRPVSRVSRGNSTRSAQRSSGKTVSLLKNNPKRTEVTAPRELSVTIAEALDEADAPQLNAAETTESRDDESAGKEQTVRRTSAQVRLQDRLPHNPLRD